MRAARRSGAAGPARNLAAPLSALQERSMMTFEEMQAKRNRMTDLQAIEPLWEASMLLLKISGQLQEIIVLLRQPMKVITPTVEES
jgi:hypothetical protein